MLYRPSTVRATASSRLRRGTALTPRLHAVSRCGLATQPEAASGAAANAAAATAAAAAARRGTAPKRGFRPIRALCLTGLAGAVLTGGAALLALNSPHAHRLWVQYVPNGEDLLFHVRHTAEQLRHVETKDLEHVSTRVKTTVAGAGGAVAATSATLGDYAKSVQHETERLAAAAQAQAHAAQAKAEQLRVQGAQSVARVQDAAAEATRRVNDAIDGVKGYFEQFAPKRAATDSDAAPDAAAPRRPHVLDRVPVVKGGPVKPVDDTRPPPPPPSSSSSSSSDETEAAPLERKTSPAMKRILGKSAAATAAAGPEAAKAAEPAAAPAAPSTNVSTVDGVNVEVTTSDTGATIRLSPAPEAASAKPVSKPASTKPISTPPHEVARPAPASPEKVEKAEKAADSSRPSPTDATPEPKSPEPKASPSPAATAVDASATKSAAPAPAPAPAPASASARASASETAPVVQDKAQSVPLAEAQRAALEQAAVAELERMNASFARVEAQYRHLVRDLVHVVQEEAGLAEDPAAQAQLESMLATISEQQAKMAQYQRTQQEALLAQATRDYLAAESALKQHVVDGQQALKQQLAQRFEAQLDTALRTQVQQLQAEYEQEMAARLRDLEGFARKQVKQLQNEEALQRLRRLDYLAHKVKVLEVSALHASDVLYSQHRIHLMLTAIRVLRETLDGPAAVVDLQTHLRALSELSDGDGFVRALLPAFRPVLPTPSSLKDGFPNVASHVRQAAYMPPNGGPLSYAISAALSAITAHKTGLIPGTDVEAIVARAEYYLARNELERSARELNQLSGWPRRLADGWLCRARALLEAQQTAGAIEDHLIYSSLDV